MVSYEESVLLIKKIRVTIGEKEVSSVLFEVKHIFELFDINHIASWLPCKLISLSSK